MTKVNIPKTINCVSRSIIPKNPKIESSLRTAISTAAEIKKGGARSKSLFRTENIEAKMIVVL